jgi:outer membrane protein assembly factor BamB
MRVHFTIQFWLTSLLSTTLVACGGAGNNTTAPAIPSQPANIATVVGNTATFSASGTAPLSNQRHQNGTAIAAETTLTLANVNATSFGLLHNVMLDGKVDAQPLYLSQVPFAGVAHNVAYVATEHGSVYAIDVDSGTPLWRISVLAPGETSSDIHGCTQVTPEIGITSTPVIDRTAGPHGVLYVVGMSVDKSSNYHQRLHAVDITTGAEMFNGPAEISATAPNAAGVTTFEPGQYEERAALLLANGQIYTSCTSHCDAAP